MDNGIVKRLSIPRELRDAVLARDGHACRYCGATDNLTIDHVYLVARGGETTLDNLVAACRTSYTFQQRIPDTNHPPCERDDGQQSPQVS